MFIVFTTFYFSCSNKKAESAEKKEEISQVQKQNIKTNDLSKESLEEKKTIIFDSLSIKDKANFLQEYLPLLSKGKSDNSEIYFNLFPKNFQEFKEIFGYYGTINKYGLPEHFGILYDHSENHIRAFFQDLKVPTDSISNRAIILTKESEWQADGVNIFQKSLRDFTDNNLELILNQLSLKEEKLAKDFWYFLYSGPHPESMSKHYSEIRMKVSEINPNLVQALDDSFNRSLNEKDH